MPALQVRDFPPDLYEELKQCAEREHRSMAQQTVVAVEAYLRGGGAVGRSAAAASASVAAPIPASIPMTPEMSMPYAPFTVIPGEGLSRAERRRRVFEKIKQMPKVDLPPDFPDAAEIIRQCREDRDRALLGEDYEELEGEKLEEGRA